MASIDFRLDFSGTAALAVSHRNWTFPGRVNNQAAARLTWRVWELAFPVEVEDFRPGAGLRRLIEEKACWAGRWRLRSRQEHLMWAFPVYLGSLSLVSQGSSDELGRVSSTVRQENVVRCGQVGGRNETRATASSFTDFSAST